jgi:effector-binding domain-containing protein
MFQQCPNHPWNPQPEMLGCRHEDKEVVPINRGSDMRRFAAYFLIVVFTIVIVGCQEKAKDEVPEKGKKAKAAKTTEGEAKPAAEKPASDSATDAAPAESKPTDAGQVADKPTDAAAVAAKEDAPVKPSAVEQEGNKAEEIVARAVAAMGGQELMANRCSSFTMETKGVFFGMPFQMTTAWKYPDKMLMEIEGGSMTMGYAGKECWNRFHTIVKDCQPEEIASYPETLWSFRVNSLYPLLGEGYDLEYAGEGEFDGKAVDKVTVTANDAPMPITLAFGKADGLLVQSTYEGNFSGKTGTVEVVVQEYRDLDGMKIMAKSVMKMDGKELMNDEYVSAVWEEVPDEKFARPAQAELGVAVVRTEHELTVATSFHKGAYESLGATIGKMYGWLGMNQIAPWGPPTMEFIKDPMSAEKPGDYLTAVHIPVMVADNDRPKSDSIWFQRVSEQNIAVRVEQGPPDQVAEAYSELARWIGEQDLIIASHPFMKTMDDPRTTPPDQLLHEIYFVVGKPTADKAREAAATEAAKGFFAACSNKNWEGAATWYENQSDSSKEMYGGLEVLEIDTAFEKYPRYPGLHVPYKVKLSDGEVKEWYLALRDDNPEKKWIVDGGL